MCGNTDYRVLQFHHVNPKEKLYNVSAMVSRGMDVVSILKEIEKTIVLCSNCHLIHHHTEREQQKVVRQSRKGKNGNVLAR
jgi:predicted HNH restriction endonuclease